MRNGGIKNGLDGEKREKTGVKEKKGVKAVD
jgi:hypothetical protein